MTGLVTSWTGRRADSLRQALRMTNESFAEHLGVSVRAVAYWRNRPDMVPSPAMQEILDAALAGAPERARDRYWALQEACEPGGEAAGLLASEDPDSLTGWLTSTSVSDDAISSLDQAATRLAESHAQAAPVVVLAEARQIQASAQGLLQAGRIRHRQARELLRINGNLLARISLLLSDLGDDSVGEDYGNAALAYLREAGTSEGVAWYVLAKIARWRHDYARSADLARAGLDRSGRDPMRVELACYEANPAALAGDTARALSAMRLADETAASLPPGRMTLSPWSFPVERMTIFRISVALRTGDPGRALDCAAAWNPGPVPPKQHGIAAWAQIRTGTAIARLCTDGPDGAAGEVAPVLNLAPEFRIATVTGWLDDLSAGSSAPASTPAIPPPQACEKQNPRFHQRCRHRTTGRDTPMTPIPAEFTDRWRDRDEPAPGQGLVYWHMLIGDHPEVVAAVQDARQRLAPFSGLHLTPLMWLHMTTLIAGPSDQIPPDHIQQMAKSASRQLADTPPITVTLGKILYHPEAIMLAATPATALTPIREAALTATREVTGTDGQPENRQWTPHITICYSTSRQPAEPVITALGRHLPERQFQVSAVSLVIQQGPERHWNWHPAATIHLAA